MVTFPERISTLSFVRTTFILLIMVQMIRDSNILIGFRLPILALGAVRIGG